MARPQPIGIDLGTTFSAVARLDASGRSAMIANAEGDILTPSLVLFEDTETIVGKAARRAGVLKAGRLAECVKRDMGSAAYSRPIRGEYLPPEAIQACILRRLKEDIVRAVGPDATVVITVPAFFDELRRKATADAGELAGLDVLDIVNEPTAAALAYGEDQGYLTSTGEVRQPMTVLVYDLGGGTFDVTLIQMNPGALRTLATDGDVRLGGRDWDFRLAELVAAQFQAEHGEDPREHPAAAQRLLNDVEEAKRTLTARQQATVLVEHAGRSTAVNVTRQQFEDATADLLERTSYTTRQVLRAAGVEWSEVSKILLVGGSSRMPMVSRMLEQLSGQTPHRTVNPDEAVARGAAIYAGYLLGKHGAAPASAFEVTDVNAHSLGIEGVDPQTGRRRNAILIPRNTPLPVSKTREFVTRAADQRSIVLKVLEGESATPEDCTPIGRTVIDSLPPALPQGWPIKVTYQYQANGRLCVRANVPGTDREATLEIERDHGMTAERMPGWKQAVDEEAGLDPFEALIAQELGLMTPQASQSRAGVRTTASDLSARSPTAAVASLETTKTMPAGNLDALPASTADAPRPDSGQAGDAKRPAMKAADGTVTEGLDGATHATQSVDAQGASVSSVGDVAGDVEPAPRRKKRGALAYLAGHLLFSALGLVIGYYVLCWIAPHANFLNLRLPGLP